MTVFRLLACAVVFFGALLDFGLVWNLADVLMGIMALINLPIILLLSKKALAVLQDYSRQKKEGKDPVFKASSVGLENETDCWK